MAALTDLKLNNRFGPDVEYLDEFFRQFNHMNKPWFLPQLQVLEFTGCLPFVSTILVDALFQVCANPGRKGYIALFPPDLGGRYTTAIQL
jgi:hypothetical protein